MRYRQQVGALARRTQVRRGSPCRFYGSLGPHQSMRGGRTSGASGVLPCTLPPWAHRPDVRRSALPTPPGDATLRMGALPPWALLPQFPDEDNRAASAEDVVFRHLPWAHWRVVSVDPPGRRFLAGYIRRARRQSHLQGTRTSPGPPCSRRTNTAIGSIAMGHASGLVVFGRRTA